MKRTVNPAFRIAATLLCLALAGCETQKTVSPVGGSYQAVTHPSRNSTDEKDLTRISFEYRGSDGKTILIWPALYGVNEVIKGNLAIFVGDVSYKEADSKGTWP